MKSKQPLSERLRPQGIHEVLGQDHIIDPKNWFYRSIQIKKPLSTLLFGPAGSGKTTLARLYANSFDYPYISISGVDGSTAEIKKILKSKKEQPLLFSPTILFVDEIHRLNKAQQDIFLPYLEDGTFILIGATTENPSFNLNNALLSRLRVVALKPLDENALQTMLIRYEQTTNITLSSKAKDLLVELAQGDGRYLLNLIENIESLGKTEISLQDVQEAGENRSTHYDRGGDEHYQLISVLHKSIRGSNPNAALYWLARMINGGEDPLYIIRRLIRLASEDIGLADPQALSLAMNTHQAYSCLGSPEGDLIIAELVVYLSLAPKSNQIYQAYKQAVELASKTSHLPSPKAMVNPSTQWMKEQGYGKDYIYDPDTKIGFSGQNYLPTELDNPDFYQPKDIGFEREMKKRIAYFKALQRSLSGNNRS